MRKREMDESAAYTLYVCLICERWMRKREMDESAAFERTRKSQSE